MSVMDRTLFTTKKGWNRELLSAIVSYDYGKAQRAIDKGADVNSNGLLDGRIFMNDEIGVKFLVEHKAKISEQNITDAATPHKFKVLEILIEHAPSELLEKATEILTGLKSTANRREQGAIDNELRQFGRRKQEIEAQETRTVETIQTRFEDERNDTDRLLQRIQRVRSRPLVMTARGKGTGG